MHPCPSSRMNVSLPQKAHGLLSETRDDELIVSAGCLDIACWHVDTAFTVPTSKTTLVTPRLSATAAFSIDPANKASRFVAARRVNSLAQTACLFLSSGLNYLLKHQAVKSSTKFFTKTTKAQP